MPMTRIRAAAFIRSLVLLCSTNYQAPTSQRANLRPPSRSARVIDRLLKNQNPLENRNNLRSSSPHLVVGRRPENRAAILRPKFMDAGAMAVPIASVRFGHSTTRRQRARRPPPREDPAQAVTRWLAGSTIAPPAPASDRGA